MLLFTLYCINVPCIFCNNTVDCPNHRNIDKLQLMVDIIIDILLVTNSS